MIKVKASLLKKHKGSGFGDIMATSICLVVILMVIIIGVNFFKLMEIKKNVNSEARAALLILEQQGELTNDNIDVIKETLAKMGFATENVSITYNENNRKVSYGEEVSIYVKATASYESLKISEILGFGGTGDFTVSTTLHSISKARS